MECCQEKSIVTPHIAMLPSPGMGHLTPFAELAKCLISIHGFTVTFITLSSSQSSTQTDFLSSLPPSISSRSLPAVSLSDAPSNARIETILSLEASRSVPAVTSILKDLKTKTNLVAFIADLFCCDLFEAARSVGLPCYMFFPSNCLFLSLMLHLPTLDATTTCEYRDLPGPLELPGCIPIPGPDLLHPLQDRSNDCYRWMVHHGSRYHEADAILVNSFQAIEPKAVRILRQHRPPVHAVGPMIRDKSTDGFDKSGCFDWLDKQPAGSVLYISFGSGGALTKEQMVELALGLERSKQRFLWMVRSPLGEEVVGTNYLNVESQNDPFPFLPPEFVERTKEVGMLVPSWAPQVSILGHQSTGGFMTHCGWNSTVESLINGVPMITWPLYAEQHQNAIMLVDGIGTALRLKERDDCLVDREEIARVVRELMEGSEGRRVRGKAKELQEVAAVTVKEGGQSYEALAKVANKLKGMSE
ncbi:Glycosyltransferase [Rhynchospora pubera]|uniref:Glycosyltransferase n=1 Tax=Rhynchospora pubera TaxID=906938 RepID=A0AAV8GRX7_9POAL|nr:Glycosyltransferase [Rhynchospora pubera]